MPLIDYPPYATAHAALHKLWSRDDGPKYDKADWMALEAAVEELGRKAQDGERVLATLDRMVEANISTRLEHARSGLISRLDLHGEGLRGLADRLTVLEELFLTGDLGDSGKIERLMEPAPILRAWDFSEGARLREDAYKPRSELLKRLDRGEDVPIVRKKPKKRP